jgi:hypothetical protein
MGTSAMPSSAPASDGGMSACSPAAPPSWRCLAIATAADRRGIVQRGIDAIAALAVVGLTLRELTTERGVHAFELREQPVVERNPVGAADRIAA